MKMELVNRMLKFISLQIFVVSPHECLLVMHNRLFLFEFSFTIELHSIGCIIETLVRSLNFTLTEIILIFLYTETDLTQTPFS